MDRRQIVTDNLVFDIVFTDSSDGDFQMDSDPQQLSRNRSKITPMPWTWVRQIHGPRVISVSKPTGFAGDADGLLTQALNCPISVTAADCSPVVLVGSNALVVLHSGWKGLEAGIIAEGARQMLSLGSVPIATVLGPHISVDSYEFGDVDIKRLAKKFGSEVIGKTKDNKLGLDMFAGVSNACEQAGWPAPERAACTSSTEWFSHRIRKDPERQVAVAWISKRQS